MVDPNDISVRDLIRSKQVAKRLHKQTFDSALEVASAVVQIRSFTQEEIASSFGDRKDERTTRNVENPLLHRPEFDIENALQFG